MKKKFVSLLLAAALVFSLGVPAFAEGGTRGRCGRSRAGNGP